MKLSGWIVILLIASNLLFAKSKVEIKEQSDKTFIISYENLRLVVEPLFGGRIVSLKLNGIELLVGKDVNKDSYGSTFWPSPQTVWDWPPPVTLDSAPYKVKVKKEKLVLTSDVDSMLGMQFQKEISIGEKTKSVKIEYSIKNISKEIKKISGWEITRMPKGGLVFFPKGLIGPKEKRFDPIPYVEKENILWYKNDANEKMSNHKLSVADGSEGWQAYAINGLIFIKKFKDVKPENQAPGEGEIPLYVHPEFPYIEVEAQGPYETINPNEKLKWEMKWYVREIPAEMKIAIGNMELVNFARSIVNKSLD